MWRIICVLRAMVFCLSLFLSLCLLVPLRYGQFFRSSSAHSSLLQRPHGDPGVQPRHKNCMEFSQAPADGKDPVHPELPRRPQDIKECKRDHLQPDPSPLSLFLYPQNLFICVQTPTLLRNELTTKAKEGGGMGRVGGHNVRGGKRREGIKQ